MATRGGIRLISPGMRAMLAGPDMQAFMERTAEDIADRARARGVLVEGEPGDVPVPIAVLPAHGRTRARALVMIDHPSGVAVESKHRLLGGALG